MKKYKNVSNYVLFFTHETQTYRLEPQQTKGLPDCPQVKMLLETGALELIEEDKKKPKKQEDRGDR